jgi:hypothetical protein
MQIEEIITQELNHLTSRQKEEVLDFISFLSMKHKKSEEPRQPGLLKGKIRMADNFDDPLPESVMSAFRGESA